MIPNKLAEFLWNQKFKDYTTFIFGSKWSNSTLYELNGKKMVFFISKLLCKNRNLKLPKSLSTGIRYSNPLMLWFIMVKKQVPNSWSFQIVGTQKWS